jgi:segregation and condensation protein A
VLRRAELYEHHAVQLEPLSVRERMSDVLAAVSEARDFVAFANLFRIEEGRMGVVVTFLAIMELLREQLLELVQTAPFAPLYVRPAGA